MGIGERICGVEFEEKRASQLALHEYLDLGGRADYDLMFSRTT